MSHRDEVQQQPQQGICGPQEQNLKRVESFRRQLAIEREAHDRWFAEMKKFINGISVPLARAASRAGNSGNHRVEVLSKVTTQREAATKDEDSMQLDFGVENPPSMDAPQVFEKSPKSGMQIRLDVGARSFVSPLADLMKLKQLGTVKQYQESFEALLNEVDLPVGEAVSCFLSGLREEIQSVVRTFKPQTLYDAICLAKLQEATLALIASRARSSADSHSSHMSDIGSQSKTMPPVGLGPQGASSSGSYVLAFDPGNIAKGSIAREVEKTQPQEAATDADKGVEDPVQVDAQEGRMEALAYEENEEISEDGPMEDENSQVYVSAYADLKSSFRVAKSEMCGDEEFLVPVENLKAFAIGLKAVCGEQKAAVTEQEEVPVSPEIQDGHSQLIESHNGQGMNLVLDGLIFFFRGGKKCWYHGWKEANGCCLLVFDPGILGAGQRLPQPKPLVYLCAWLIEILADFKLLVVRLVFDPGEKIVITMFSSGSHLEAMVSGLSKFHENSAEGGPEEKPFSAHTHSSEATTQWRPLKLVYDHNIRPPKMPLNCNFKVLSCTDKLRLAEACMDSLLSKDSASHQIHSLSMSRMHIVEVSSEQYPAVVEEEEKPMESEETKVDGSVSHSSLGDSVVESIETEADKMADRAVKETLKEEAEVSEGTEYKEIEMNEWLFELAQLLSTDVGVDSDAHIDPHELGMEPCSEALEEATTSGKAQLLFDKAALKFQEVTALVFFNLGNVHMCAARKWVPVDDNSPVGGGSAPRYCHLSGSEATSNMAAGRVSGMPFVSTHSHAFVSSFMNPVEIMETSLCSAGDLTIWEGFVGLVHIWLHKSQKTKVFVEDQLKIKLLDGFELGKVKLQQVLVQAHQKFPQASHVQLYTALGVLVAPVYKRKNSNKIVFAGLPGSGKTILFCQLQDGSPHQGTVTPMDPNDGTFVLNSEAPKRGQFQLVNLIDASGHSHLRSKEIPLLIVCNNSEQVSVHSKELIQLFVKTLGGIITGSSKRILSLRGIGFVFDPGGKIVSRYISPSPTELGHVLNVDELGTIAAESVAIPVRELGRGSYKAVVFLFVQWSNKPKEEANWKLSENVSNGVSLPSLVSIDPPLPPPKQILLKGSARHFIPSVSAAKASLKVAKVQGKEGILSPSLCHGMGCHEDVLRAELIAAEIALGHADAFINREQLDSGIEVEVPQFQLEDKLF